MSNVRSIAPGNSADARALLEEALTMIEPHAIDSVVVLLHSRTDKTVHIRGSATTNRLEVIGAISEMLHTMIHSGGNL